MTSLQFEFTRISFIDNTLTVAFEGRVVSRIKLSSLTFGIAHHQLQHCEQQKTSLPHTYNFATRLNLPVPEVPIHTLHLLYVGFDVSGNSYTGEVLIDWRKHQHFFEILNGRIHRKLQFPRVPQLEFRNPTRPLVCTPQEPIQLSACIAYSGSISQLAHCLEALLRCTSGTPEIFVYGAIDLDQEQALHSHFPGVHTLPFPDESSAKLLGRNKCCEVACGDLLLFMDDTLSIDPASKLPTDEQSNGSLFACGACILSPKGMVLHAGGICWQGAWPSFFVAQSFESDPLIQRTRETHFCSGGFIFISRQLFIQATMLPENLKTTTAQDCALGLQLRTMRQPIAYIPQLLVHSARSRLSQSIQASDYRYLQTHYPPLPRLWPSPFLTSSRDAVLLSTQHHRNLVLEYPLEPTPSFFPESPGDEFMTLRPQDRLQAKRSFVLENFRSFASTTTRSLTWARLLPREVRLTFVTDGIYCDYPTLLRFLDSELDIVEGKRPAITNFHKHRFFFDPKSWSFITQSQFLEFTSSVANVQWSSTDHAADCGELDVPLATSSSNLTILIPVFNQLDLFKQCLNKLAQSQDVAFHLVIVNDGSSEFTTNVLNSVVHQSGFPDASIVHLNTNRGFPYAVNVGLLFSQGDVLLLNSDTELECHAVYEMLKVKQSHKRVASVTAVSDDRSICGIQLQSDSLNSACVDPSNIYKALKSTLTDDSYPLPSGVGYCMLMTHEALCVTGLFDSATFGKGYGEENDWCMRACQGNFQHLLAPHAFVTHHGGKSFDQIDTYRDFKAQLVHSLHPCFGEKVAAFHNDASLKHQFTKLRFTLSASDSSSSAILWIDAFQGSGGAHEYASDEIQHLRTHRRVYGLLHAADGFYFCDYNWDEPAIQLIPREASLLDKVSEYIQVYEIQQQYVNNLVGSKRDELLDVIESINIPYEVFLHDFFLSCPSVHLRNSKNEYCNAETLSATCEQCLDSVLQRRERIPMQAVYHGIQRWRARSNHFLHKAMKVQTPSNAALNILQRYFPDLPIEVHPHRKPNYCSLTFRREFTELVPLQIGVLGNLSEDKGVRLIYNLAQYLEENEIPMRLTVIGSTAYHTQATHLFSNYLTIHGPYQRDSVSSLLAHYQCGLVLLPFIVPETYSYTTDEAIYSGYPVLVSDIGAPAERVRTLSAGWTFPHGQISHLQAQLHFLASNRGELVSHAWQPNQIIADTCA